MSITIEKPDTTKRINAATEVGQFIADLDAGVFEQKLGVALSEVAAAVVDYDKPGEVVVKFKIKRIADSAAVVVSHALQMKRPTTHGDCAETDTTNTPMYISVGGKMTLYPLGGDTADMFNK